MAYLAPHVFESKFTCPHCDTVAKQNWQARTEDFSQFESPEHNAIRVATCEQCNHYSLWHADVMVYPNHGAAPPSNPDMPLEVKQYYAEAATIALKSPRSAAALLRLAIQLLCAELGEDGQNLEFSVMSLVRRGLPITIQQALDVMHVIGPDAVRPGFIDTDGEHVVFRLFDLLNLMVEYMVTLPNRVDTLNNRLACETLELIQQRGT
ncbi:MAG TPA: DUF4145 domain-containing protein [Pirellulales bacterium]|jgi:hypothetical protein|nr:DUF4145 domain-containing protein [Pirellulales bacterium]